MWLSLITFTDFTKQALIRVKLSSYERDHMMCEVWHVYCLALYRKICCSLVLKGLVCIDKCNESVSRWRIIPEGKWLFGTENVSVWKWRLSIERPEKVSRPACKNPRKSFLGNSTPLGMLEKQLEIERGGEWCERYMGPRRCGLRGGPDHCIFLATANLDVKW